MKVYSLLCLPLVSFAAICACKPSHTVQAGKKITEMEKKEQIMLEDAKPKSEEEALENYFTPSRKGLISWVLTDTATLSYPFTKSIEKKIRYHRHVRRPVLAHLFMGYGWRWNHDPLGQPYPIQKRKGSNGAAPIARHGAAP